MICICKYCKHKFINKWVYKNTKFCSRFCYGKSLTGIGKPKIAKINRHNYIYIYSPDHPSKNKQKYVAEHRLIMEQHLGRFLTKKEVVHHINEDTTDNRIENLQLFSSAGQHTKFAHPNIKGIKIEPKFYTKKCPMCSIEFTVGSKKKLNITCSKKCSYDYRWGEASLTRSRNRKSARVS